MAGLVIDYEILSKYCHACTVKTTELGEDNPEFREWYAAHGDNCAAYYTGTSSNMETDAAIRIWIRSVSTNGLKHAGLLSDGDYRPYNAVCEFYPHGGVEINKK